KGHNMGWRRMEGDKCFDFQKPDAHPASCDKAGLTEPVMVYANCTAVKQNCMGISVTGGYVYRGSPQPLQGKYIFGDWSKGFDALGGPLLMVTHGGAGKWATGKATFDRIDTAPPPPPLPPPLNRP